MLDGKPYFPATDCAKILGYNQPEHAINRHCKGCTFHTPLTAGGVQQKKYIPEGDLYRLIIRSKLPEAIRFEAWVCDTVLPAIRQHGAYITDNALDHLIENPEAAMKFFETLKAERDEKESLEKYVELAAPKVLYYDIILQCPGAVQPSIIAKDYGMSARVFNQLLHGLGFQYKMGKTWLVYAAYDDKGYTISKTYDISENKTAIHTYFTQKGRAFLYEFLKKHGVLPLVERAE